MSNRDFAAATEPKPQLMFFSTPKHKQTWNRESEIVLFELRPDAQINDRPMQLQNFRQPDLA